MYLLFETLKVENGEVCNIDYHQSRVNRTFRALFPAEKPISIIEAVKTIKLPTEDIHRLRITYDTSVRRIEVVPYVRRSINKLIAFDVENIDYSYKFDDRSAMTAFAQKIPADCEPLFIVDGMVTDTSFSNIAFFDGESWYTPSTYLLRGTKRDFYVSNGFINERKITFADICIYQKASLINAMCDIGDIILNIEKIERGK